MTLEDALHNIAGELRRQNFNSRREFLLKFDRSSLKVRNIAMKHIATMPVHPFDPVYAALPKLSLLVEGTPLWSRPLPLRLLP